MVSEYFHPCDNATGHIMTSLAQQLSGDFRLKVLTTTPGYATGSVIENENLTIARIRDSKLDKNKLLQRLVRITVLSFRLFFALLREIKKDQVVISVTNPTALTILLMFGKLIRGYRVILIVHDVFPENLIATGIIRKKNPLYPLIRGIFNLALGSFEALLVIGRDMEQIYKTKVRKPGRIIFLPNFSDTVKITPGEKSANRLVWDCGLENKLVILFTGNIGRAQNIPFICQVILQMKDNPDVHFLFIGGGAMKANLESFLRDHGLKNATLLPEMPRENENIFLNAGDIGLVLLTPGLKGLGVPSKAYAYMAAGKPLLSFVEPGSEIDLLIREHDIGWSMDPCDIDRAARKISSLVNLPLEISRKGAEARKVCERFYTPEIYAAHLKLIINKLYDPRKS